MEAYGHFLLKNPHVQAPTWEKHMRKFFILTSTILLVACNHPLSTPSLVSGSGTVTLTNQPCYFNWTTQPLPDLSTQVQAAIETTGLRNVHAAAEAYGENCYDARTNQPVSFAAMETDFRVTAQVKDLTDREQLGNLLEQILIVLDGFPVGKTPGPQPGYIGFTFQVAGDELRLWFPVADGISARDQRLHGAALLDYLQK